MTFLAARLPTGLVGATTTGVGAGAAFTGADDLRTEAVDFATVLDTVLFGAAFTAVFLGAALATTALVKGLAAAFFATGLAAAFLATGLTTAFLAGALASFKAALGADLDADLATGLTATFLAGALATGFLTGDLGTALDGDLAAVFTGFFAAEGAALTLVRCLAAGAAGLAVFLAGDFTSALLLSPDTSRFGALTPRVVGMDVLVNAGLFIPGLLPPLDSTGVDGLAKLLKKVQNIKPPPAIAQGLGPKYLEANRYQ
jgi:hypothetical protein